MDELEEYSFIKIGWRKITFSIKFMTNLTPMRNSQHRKESKNKKKRIKSKMYLQINIDYNVKISLN